MLDSKTPWPPHYSVRSSQRAKRIIIQISPKYGLQVIVPHKKRNPDIESLLLEKRAWIEKNLPTSESLPAFSAFSLPTSLHFHAIQKVIQFTYIKSSRSSIKITHHRDNDYWILGPIEDVALVLKGIKRFLKKLAEVHLIPWLHQLSVETCLPFSSVVLRSQSTLWGSCTVAHKINLNIKLLFLPLSLTRYVLLHELCHTQHLNHSKRFWNLLKKFDPNCLAHRRALRQAGDYVPIWL